MNWTEWCASVIIILVFIIYFVFSLQEPACKEGYVGSFNLLRTGWSCIPGYKP